MCVYVCPSRVCVCMCVHHVCVCVYVCPSRVCVCVNEGGLNSQLESHHNMDVYMGTIMLCYVIESTY